MNDSDRQVREFYANIIDSVGDGVVVLDNDGAVSYMNPAAEEITAISRRQGEGQRFSDLFKGEDVLLEMVAKTGATGMSISDYENIVLSKFGHLTPVSATTNPLLLSNGLKVGTILVLRDLTNIRDLEDALRHADRLSTLGTLAAGLAHEIKNPLGGIKGAAQLLDSELSAESELRDYTRVVIKEVERVNRILQELLDLAAPKKLTLERVNLHRVMQDIVLLQKRSTAGKQVVFQQHFDPSIPPILVDEGLITRLFINLVKNAIEALEDGGIIRVTSRVVSDYSLTQKGERPSRMVAVEVTDNGRGITAEEKNQIFTPFFSSKSQGTGLGLAICHKIVAEHRGMIKVESKKGKGTTFTVMLPLIQ